MTLSLFLATDFPVDVVQAVLGFDYFVQIDVDEHIYQVLKLKGCYLMLFQIGVHVQSGAEDEF